MYMNSSENELSSQAGDSTNPLVEGYKVDGNETKVSIFSLWFPCGYFFLSHIEYGICLRVKECEEGQSFCGGEVKFAG